MDEKRKKPNKPLTQKITHSSFMQNSKFSSISRIKIVVIFLSFLKTCSVTLGSKASLPVWLYSSSSTHHIHGHKLKTTTWNNKIYRTRFTLSLIPLISTAWSLSISSFHKLYDTLRQVHIGEICKFHLINNGGLAKVAEFMWIEYYDVLIWVCEFSWISNTELGNEYLKMTLLLISYLMQCSWNLELEMHENIKIECERT